MSTINWQPTCCGWHGDYAEQATKDGGIARLKRSLNMDGIQVMRFSVQNKRIDADYILMPESEVLKLLA